MDCEYGNIVVELFAGTYWCNYIKLFIVHKKQINICIVNMLYTLTVYCTYIFFFTTLTLVNKYIIYCYNMNWINKVKCLGK